MDNVLNFLSENYIYFLIGSVVLLLFLIGYIVVEKKNKKKEENVSATAESPVVTQTENVAPVTPVEPMQTAPVENTMPTEPTVKAPSLDAFNSNATATPVEEPVVGEAPVTPTVETPVSEPAQEPASIFDTPEANATMEQLPPKEPTVEASTIVIEDNSTPAVETQTENVAPVTPVEPMQTDPVENTMPTEPIVEAPALDVPTVDIPAVETPVVEQTQVQEPVQPAVVQPEVPVQDNTAQPM